MPPTDADISHRHALAPEVCATFGQDGVLCPLDVMSEEEAATVRGHIEAQEAQSHGRLSGLTRVKPHLLLPFLWDIVHDPRIVGPVASLLGPDIYCIGSSIIDKPAGSDGYVAWHQDATFWGLSDAVGATAWLALSAANSESGCMEVIPGTHTRQLAHLDTQDARNMLGAREAVRQDIDRSQARALVLRPGQMSLHHPLVLHGSGRNLSADRRLGFVIRYVPAAISQDGATVTLVAGRNISGMPLETAPEGALTSDALARHADIIRRAGRVIRRAKEAHLRQADASPETGT
ncbi:MAG: phytanoyl-CoA dioxygenase family protein [Roseovarius sp.]|uniref:phytanoyl-CoA dioxygenase family protein n=1 Tax=Roseovarius sp. TaxID=1486281 RepID=UPI001B660E6D|nr:phytanoyl-CoA dioxygenase family protein [Roseovarius sp.]MBQ0751396.1 phytanoyl-CoA dioxygenase family protein [Roseovarius sp.]MBQ0810712.1 phytanoyl-CoA dioxygenase family protein [Roseovarius sp.]